MVIGTSRKSMKIIVTTRKRPSSGVLDAHAFWVSVSVVVCVMVTRLSNLQKQREKKTYGPVIVSQSSFQGWLNELAPRLCRYQRSSSPRDNNKEERERQTAFSSLPNWNYSVDQQQTRVSGLALKACHNDLPMTSDTPAPGATVIVRGWWWLIERTNRIVCAFLAHLPSLTIQTNQ